MNGITATYVPITLSGLETIDATNITINGVDISTIYVPFINSPNDVDLGSKNLTTTGRVQTTVLKLPSLTQSTTKFLQLDVNKEVISTDLAGTFVTYTASTNNLDMGVYRVFTTAVPSFNNELVNKLYVDTTFPNFGYLSAFYLTQANASTIYAPIASPTFTGTVSGITSSMVGLGNVDNTSDLNKPVSTATQTALNLKANLASPTFTGTVSGITSTMVGLGNVDNTSDLNKPVSTATQTALNLKANLASPTFTGTVSGITSTMVGLGNVDNTSDANKPVSTATQTALNLKSDLANPTFTGSVTLPSVSFTSTPSSGTGTLLAINGSNQIVTTTSSINQTNTSTAGTYYLPFVASASTGSFVPLANAGLTCDPSLGLIRSNRITANTQLETYSMKITNVPAGTQTFLLAVDSAGNVIQGTSLSALQQTRTTTNATFYVPFVSSFTTGTFTPLIENKLLFNPATGLLSTNQLLIYGNANIGSLTFSTNPATGTVAFYLAIDSAGVVIRTSAAGGDAYLANTQTFTGDNTFSGIVYASRIYAQNTGAVMEYDTRSTYAHQFKVNGNVLAQIGTLGLAVNNIVNLNAVNLVINGNGSGVIVFQASGTTMATIDGNGLNVDNIQTTSAGTDLNLYASTSRAVNLWSSGVKVLSVESTKMIFDIASGFYSFRVNGNVRFAVTDVLVQSLKPHLFSAGAWMPVDGSTSFYITDTQPDSASTAYGRYFGYGATATIYQDFYNIFQWRVYSGISPLSGLTEIMKLTTTGLTINKSSSSHATLANYELVLGDNTSTSNYSAKMLIRGTSANSAQCPSIDFTGWYSHTTIQGSIALYDDGNYGGIFAFIVKPLGSTASGAAQSVMEIRATSVNVGRLTFPTTVYADIVIAGQLVGGFAHSGADIPLKIITGYSLSGSYWFYAGGATWTTTSVQNMSILAYGTISANSGFTLASDIRIKKDIQPAEQGALKVIDSIPIKSYDLIDNYRDGGRTSFNIIAQELIEVFPEAISKGMSYIPSIYSKCQWIIVNADEIEIHINKPHDLVVGDELEILLEDSSLKECDVTAIINDTTFRVKKWDDFKMEITDECFIYGKKVKDFLRIDKTKVSMLALAGTKELHQIVKHQQAKIEEQSLAINTLTDSVKTLTEHLSKLTLAFNEFTKK